MARYEKTTATVIGSAVGTAVTGGGKMGFYPKVMYRYQVNGQEYVGDRYTQNLVSSPMKGRSERMIARHPIGSTIEIYYNVKDPSDSFHQKGFGSGVYKMFLFIFVFLLIMLVFALVVSGTITLPG